jgi:hypothetical protein
MSQFDDPAFLAIKEDTKEPIPGDSDKEDDNGEEVSEEDDDNDDEEEEEEEPISLLVEEAPAVGDVPAIPQARAAPKVQFVLLDDTDDDKPHMDMAITAVHFIV